MCGIAGILRIHEPQQGMPRPLDSIPEAWLDILDDSIKHRGPDGRGRFRQRIVRGDGAVVDVALVHRRLSIIDLAGGGQPMVIGEPMPAPAAQRTRTASKRGGADAPSGSGSDHAAPSPALLAMEGSPYSPMPRPHVCPRCTPGVTAVVFNGCIYNHRELRRELQAAGHEFMTDHSDTEVLLHGWRQWGPGVIDRLDGMFALVIWDEASGRVYSARDRFGEKPLASHINVGHDVYIWCSVPAGIARLAAHAGQTVQGSEDPLDLINTSFWAQSGFWRDLPYSWHPQHDPGEHRLLEYCDEDSRLHEQGTQPESLIGSPRRDAAALNADAVHRLVSTSVRSRLDADTPIACFLSGGVDSSLLAAIAKPLLGSLRTFTVRMPSPEYDESAYAARVADHLGTTHETLDVDVNPSRDLVALVEQLGLPFGDSSLLPAYWLSKATRQHVKVAISGDGGDELFCGYERHRALLELKRWRAAAARIPSSILPRRDPKSRWSKLARLGQAARWSPNIDLVAAFTRSEFGRLCGERPTVRGGVADPSHWDTQQYLPQDLLRKTDTASMAVALEVRAPFLQRELALAALSEPLSSLMPHGQRKGLLRAVARRYLPAEIVDRPKQGFAIPISEWFRTDYGGMRQLLMDHLRGPEPFPGLAEAGINLNMAFVEQMLREHDAAGEKSIWPWKGRDHGQRLYMLLVLSIWCKWLAGIRRGSVA